MQKNVPASTQKKLPRHVSKGLTLMSYNCRSLRNKIHEVTDLICETDVDLAFIQETWLLKSDCALVEEIREYGYEVFTERKTRKVDRGGGLALVYKKTLKVKASSYKQYSSFES